MTKLEELGKAKKEATNMETLLNWKSWLPYMTPLGYGYDKGEARRYYKDKRGYYYYRVVTEAELHRNE